MQKYFLLLILICQSSFSKVSIPYQIGSSSVVINYYNKGTDYNFIHLHNNETTSLQAGLKTLKICNASLISLEHSGKRNIEFLLNNKKYCFDPNRIYTDKGIAKTLTSCSHYNKQAAQLIKKFADKVLSLIKNKQPIIALHNNKYYSIKNYYPRMNMAKDAKRFYKNPNQNFRNFYFVTHDSDYKLFKKLGFNVVLQNNKSVTDDGSLSVALADQEYFNVESGYNKLSQQVNMISTICRNKEYLWQIKRSDLK